MPKVKFTCTNCGRAFRDYASNRTKSKSGNFFCSRKCKGEYQTRQAIRRVPKKTHSECRTCGKVKPVSEFYRDRRCRANGYVQYDCKECVKVARMAYYDENRDAIIARVRAYAAGHPEVARRHGAKQRRRQTKEERQAWAKLNREVQAGRVKSPVRCEMCGKRRKLHAHHTDGYGLENALKVKWVCARCHHQLHGRGPNCR